MFLDGVLIPAALLTNGHSIVQVQSVDQVDYFHLELDSHDVIVAEGALSESYVEDGNRGMFHNAREYAALYPDAAAAPAGLYCAPRLEDGELLEAIRRRLSGAPAAPAAQAKLTGWLDRVERGQIVGWAQDGAEPVHLRIVVDGATIGDVVADLPRPDVQAANGGALRCGFAYTIPGGLPPGGAHMIAVQRSADGAALPSSPRRLEMAPVAPRAEKAQPKLRGNLDRADRHQVAGWAQAGATPVALQILDNGIPVGRLLANRWRADVAEAGIGDGRHAFEFNFPTPLSATARHSIEVRRESDGAVLAGGPIAIEAADSFDPALEQAVAQAVAGLQGHDRARVLSFIIGQADRLKQQEADDAAGRTVRAAARRAGAAAGLRALVIDAEVPVADRDAGSQAILSHMRALQRLGYEVSFVAAEQMQRDGAALTAAGIAHCAAPFYASVEDVLRRQEGCFDVVYLHRLAMAEAYLGLVRRWLPKARAVYAVADLHHVRLARQADCEQRPELLAAANRARLAEFTAAWNADVVLTHSPAEAAVLRAAVPRATVRLVPWEVAPQPGAAGFAARGGIGFIGNYSHAPNADAARFLVQEIMPLVWAADPAITCALAGSAMPASLRGLARPGVHVLGHVDDIAGFFGGLRLTVAPLRFGAGIKGKVLDSLAAGVPCVVTPVAAEGLEMPADLVGADAPALAQAILRLHGDAAAHATARAAGLRLIERTNSAARVDNALATALGHRLPLAAGAIA
jgi:glycosyltransferase involved in cell wall biosynthesis